MTAKKFLVLGDVHGHLQLALCVAARWQEVLGEEFEAVLLCGDVGVFPDLSRLDKATLRYSLRNPCEIEFALQWAADPPAPWLDYIFLPREDGGLGLLCPVVMVHGNHEDFNHLSRLVNRSLPAKPVPMAKLPTVDPGMRLKYLPTGWKTVTPSGAVIAGVGGAGGGSGNSAKHPWTFIDDNAVTALMTGTKFDILITHQGPSGVQGNHGSESLQLLLDAQVAALWFHGHSTPVHEAPPFGRTEVFPLDDIVFGAKGAREGQAGPHGWALASLDGASTTAVKETPPFLSDFDLGRWKRSRDGLLICPALARLPQAW